MVNNSDKKSSHPKCFQCGSQLIFVSQETIQPDGSRYPQINTVYRCSNEECQEKKDKAKTERLKFRQNQADLMQERMEKMQEKRRRGRESKLRKH
jgi:hypothetical protein